MPFHIRPFLALWLALITLPVLSSIPAYAEWVELGHDHAGMTVYVNQDTIRRKGDLVKMWNLKDFSTTRTRDGNSYRSNKTQTDYDCAEERSWKLASTFFSGNMGSGDVVYTISKEGKWQLVEPGSLGQSEWDVACDKE